LHSEVVIDYPPPYSGGGPDLVPQGLDRSGIARRPPLWRLYGGFFRRPLWSASGATHRRVWGRLLTFLANTRIAAAMAVRQIGLVEDYDGLIGILRLRLSEVGSSCENVSALAGLTDTHISKIVCPARSKVLGRISFSVLLQVLGIRLVAVVDDAAHEPLRRRLKPATFHRWNRPPREGDGDGIGAETDREMKIRTAELVDPPVIERVPELRAAAVAKPRPRFDPEAPHPMPVRSHLRYGPRRARNGARSAA
jgi:hypothetical protein